MTKFFKLFLIFFIVKFMENVISFDPLLTYTMRYHQVKFYPNISGNYTISQYNNIQYVNGNITLNSTKTINKVLVVFNRCNPEGINCEYFQSWALTDICRKLKEPNQIWSSLYGKFDPPMVCPIDKTYYKLKNVSLEVDQIIRWYAEAVNYQWRVIQTFYSGDIYVGSYTVDFSIFGYRKRHIKSLLNH